MDSSPCHECSALIGAGSGENPHAPLTLMKYPKDKRAEPLAHISEFYKCSLCNTLLVRDPPRLRPFEVIFQV